MTVEEAVEWLDGATRNGSCAQVGPLPGGTAELGAARAPILVSTRSETPAGALAVYLARPIRGYHFPLIEEPGPLPDGEPWEVGGSSVTNPGPQLLGLAWFDSSTGFPAAGLLVGRMERRAWLGGQKLRPAEDLYGVDIHLEPERIELADLELEVEERVGEELVIAERLRMEDVYLGGVDDQPRVSVALPTLGRRIKRTVRLHDRDGHLLDEWQPYNLAESVETKVLVDGVPTSKISTGDPRAAPEIVELLGAVERIRTQYGQLRREGMRQRLFQDRAEGRKALRRLLKRASGGVLVVDPYFKDWDLLDDLSGPPPRVLIGSGVDGPPEEIDVRVRRWRGSNVAPFHDRCMLWDGGGVVIGTSSGPGANRLYRLIRISAAESDEMQQFFALWWDDPGFEPLR